MGNIQTNIDFWKQVLKAPTAAYEELFRVEKEYLLENITPSDFVLDIGCGEGRNISSIIKKTENVYGIDNDPKAVRDVQKHFKDHKNIKIFCAEAEKLPFEDSTFDTVTFLIILPNLEYNKETALKESVRVLKDKGHLILSTFSDTAFEERIKMYNILNVPIKEIIGTKVIFDKSLGANTSEQFSLEELTSLGNKVGLRMIDSKKIGDIAYICKFEK